MDEDVKQRVAAAMAAMGGVGSPALPSPNNYEAMETLLANLFIMQVMAVARQDALIEILTAEGLLTPERLEAMNRDVQAAVRDVSGVDGSHR